MGVCEFESRALRFRRAYTRWVLFKPEMVKAILSGKKSQTRRIGATCRYQPGRSYAVQPGRGKPASLRITITDVRQEQLGEISLKDAKREGFHTTDEFREYWEDLHHGWTPTLLVWVLTFVKGEHTDSPRLLAMRPGPPHGDYTSVPALSMRGEQEAVPATIQKSYSREAFERDSARRAALRKRALTAVEQIIPYSSGRERKRLRAAANQIRAIEKERAA